MNEDNLSIQTDESVKGTFFNFGTDDDGNFVLQINIVMSIEWALQLARGIFSVAKTLQQQKSGIVVVNKMPPPLQK